MPDGWQSAVAALTDEVSALTAEVGSLTTQISGLTSQVANLQSQLGQTSRVVASQTFSQSGSLDTVTLFTPATDGNFRLSVYFTSPTSVLSGAAVNAITPQWQDELGLQGYPFELVSAAKNIYHDWFFRAAAGTAIGVSVLPASSAPYDLSVVLEQLS